MTDPAASSTLPNGPHAQLSQPYQYASLEDKPRTIRLLKIQHECTEDGLNWHGQDQHERVRCREPCCEGFNVSSPRIDLHERSFDENPKYEAISYAWGDAALLERVVCGSGVLRVTKNCYDLLWRLRERNTHLCAGTKEACDATDDLYWIDALCINQDFQRERNHQVGMMATIYEKAVRVIVWPGKVEEPHSVRHALLTALRSGELWNRHVCAVS